MHVESDLSRTQRVDLHVHSRFSEPSTDWFMQQSGMSESYSDPLRIYEAATKAGMSMVTVTDHNSIKGSLILKEKYGGRVITGVESTVYFPEDKCKIHLLIYGITEKEFLVIQRLRTDIYQLRAYLKERNLAHSVAHATYSVETGKLTLAHLEKLLVLFNTFEIINGGRNRTDNLAWKHILQNLTPECIETLSKKHSIEPFDTEPWIKGFTAGSDDHGCLFVGSTYTQTQAPCSTVQEFLQALKDKKTSGEGRHSDYRSLVFSVYKVVHDFTRHTGNGAADSLVGRLAETLFDRKRLGIAARLGLRRWKNRAAKNSDPVNTSLRDLVEAIETRGQTTMEERVERIYAGLAGLSDSYFKLLLNSLDADMAKLDLLAFARNLQSSVSGVLLSLPFIISLRHLNQNRFLVENLGSTLSINKAREGSRVLWFTDSLMDLNGVSVTLNEVCRLVHDQGLDVKIATCLDPDQVSLAPPNVLNLPFIHQAGLPYYDHCRLRFPSVLMALKEIYQFDPDRIFISTPGPIGMLGLLAAKLMSVKTTGFYHTDFARQAQEIVHDESVAYMLESFTRWFYSTTDEIMVPTSRYMDILTGRGFKPGKMKLFTRGFDLDHFKPRANSDTCPVIDLASRTNHINLLYVGRISRDKHLELLLEAHARIMAGRPTVHLLIVGDGPDLDDLRSADRKGVHFMGKVAHLDLPAIYATSHLFVFPSATDTFGKAVLEAQACGLPAIVSDTGGPQEIVIHGKTGLVARAGDTGDWHEKIEYMLDMMKMRPSSYEKMRQAARSHVMETYTWDGMLDLLTERSNRSGTAREKKIA